LLKLLTNRMNDVLKYATIVRVGVQEELKD
jgi:hypothetical protein